MNPFFQHIITEVVRQRLKNKKYRPTQFEKAVRNTKVEFVHVIKDSIFILLGVLSASFGLKGFLLPNLFIDGGVTGIALIITELTEAPLSILLVAINLPFILLAFSTISKQFAIRSIIAIILLAVVVHFVPLDRKSVV